MKIESSFKKECEQFGSILGGKGEVKQEVCSVSLHRPLTVHMQGKKSNAILGVSANFESLDHHGNALNTAEVVLLDEEVPTFTYALVQQGLIIGALHNHWLLTTPNLLYVHIQSIEPPAYFAQKLAYAFSFLQPPPQ